MATAFNKQLPQAISPLKKLVLDYLESHKQPDEFFKPSPRVWIEIDMPTDLKPLFARSKSDWMIDDQPYSWKADLVKNFLSKKASAQQYTNVETLTKFIESRWPAHPPFAPIPTRGVLCLSSNPEKPIPNHQTPVFAFLYKLQAAGYLTITKDDKGRSDSIILSKSKITALSEALGQLRVLSKIYPHKPP